MILFRLALAERAWGGRKARPGNQRSRALGGREEAGLAFARQSKRERGGVSNGGPPRETPLRNRESGDFQRPWKSTPVDDRASQRLSRMETGGENVERQTVGDWRGKDNSICEHSKRYLLKLGTPPRRCLLLCAHPHPSPPLQRRKKKTIPRIRWSGNAVIRF